MQRASQHGCPVSHRLLCWPSPTVAVRRGFSGSSRDQRDRHLGRRRIRPLRGTSCKYTCLSPDPAWLQCKPGSVQRNTW